MNQQISDNHKKQHIQNKQPVVQDIQYKKQFIYNDDDFFYDPLPQDGVNDDLIKIQQPIQINYNKPKPKQQIVINKNNKQITNPIKISKIKPNQQQESEQQQQQQSLIRKYDPELIKKTKQFQWPLQKDLYKYSRILKAETKCIRAFVHHLRQQFKSLYPNILYKFNAKLKQSQKIMTVSCQRLNKKIFFCHWKLVYEIVNDQTKQLKLKYYNNIHRHTILKNQNNNKKKLRMNLSKDLNILQNKVQLQKKLKQIANWTDKYESRKKSQLNQFFKQKLPIIQSFQQQIYSLRIKHYKVYTISGQHKKQKKQNNNNFENYLKQDINQIKINDQQQVLLIISSGMKYLFKNYNRVLFIQKYPIFQNSRTKTRNKKYTVIMFNGLSFKATRVCFGLAIIRNINLKKYEIMFKIFFTQHKIYPLSVLIDLSQPLIAQAFKNVIHINFPKINLVLRQMRTRYGYSSQYYRHCIQAQASLIQKMILHLRPGGPVNHYNKRYYFRPQNLYTPNVIHCYDNYYGPFVGFNLFPVQSPSFIKQSNTMYNYTRVSMHLEHKWNLKANIVPLKYYLKIVIGQIEEMNKNYFQHFPFKDQIQLYYNHIDRLDKIKCTISKKPFGFLMRSIDLATTCTISAYHRDFCFVQNKYYSYVVSVTGKRNPPFRCDCRYYQKSGIPCQHIVKVAEQYGINIINCVDVYWLINFAIVGLDSKPERYKHSVESLNMRRGRPRRKGKGFGNVQDALQNKQ